MYFPIYAHFEADNDIETSSVGNKATNIYIQNPACNYYYIISELDDVLKSEFYESPLGYNNGDWFIDVALKLGNKLSFF